MSIATAENAGLVPCDLQTLSSQWANNNNNNNIASNNNTQFQTSTPQQAASNSIAASLVSHTLLGGGGGIGGLPLTPQEHQVLMHQAQAKLMNAVAPAVACPPASAKKIRRKTDNKPQSQINKCNNEKRRRELENEYIEQLGEFLQINKRDMTTTKPDKAAILSEVVKTFRRLHDEHQLKGTNPVQQGEVSSTEPEPSLNGHSPEKTAYYEAVQHYLSNVGWVLLEINSEGVIEHATKNVCDVLHYTSTELLGKSIYSYLHPGDHSRLSPILDKHTFSLGWEQEDTSSGSGSGAGGKKTVSIRVRWLIKQSEGLNDTMEQKQQRQDKYKDLLIVSAPLKEDVEESPSMLCLITMPEDENTVVDHSTGDMQPQMPTQMTIKMETTSTKIVDLDISQLRPEHRMFLSKEKVGGLPLVEICHYQDRVRVTKHLNEARQTTITGVISEPYRIQVGPEAYLTVKAQSKLFTPKNDMSFIMAVHTILNESDMASLDLQDPSGAGSSSMHHQSSSSGPLPGTSQLSLSSSGNSSMGDPLISSVVNGGNISQCLTNTLNMNQMYDNQPSSDTDYYNTFGDFEFPHSTLDTMDPVGLGNWPPATADSRPDSRTSIASNSTPRPPSVTGYSPAPQNQMCPSPFGGPASVGGQQSPSHNNNNFSGFKNSNESREDQKMGADKMGSGACGSDKKPKAQDSDRLRSLLTSKRPSLSSGGGSNDSSSDNKNLILKGLLNDDDSAGAMNRKCGLPGRLSNEGAGGHRMLEQLLNEKSSDDDDQDGGGRNKNSELLKHLNKGQNPKENPKSDQEIYSLLKIQDSGLRKRSMGNDGENSAAKRPAENKGSLRERNKMLASLLEQNPKAPAIQDPVITPRIIPDIPSSHSITSTTSQPSPSSTVSSGGPGTPTSGSGNLVDKMSVGRQQMPQLVRKPSDNYLIPPNIAAQQQQQKEQLMRQQSQQQTHLTQQQQLPLPRVQPNFEQNLSQFLSPIAMGGIGGVQAPSEIDPELQQILNGLMSDYMPTDGSAQQSYEPNIDLLSAQELNQSSAQYQQELDKRLRITQIEKQLMSVEANPYSGNPPTYSMHTNTQMGGNFTPPPNYPRRLPPHLQQNNPNIAQRAVANMQQQMARNQPNVLQQIQYGGSKVCAALEKERLLQQQKTQQIVIHANAQTTDFSSAQVQNIDALINNSIAPNVTLRNTSSNPLPPDSQLSPGYSPNMLQQQLSPNQRTTFSPQQGYTPNQFNRLSPQQQQQLVAAQQQVQQMVQVGNFGGQQNPNQFGASPGPAGGAQLSPMTRQFSSPAGTPTGGQVQSPVSQWGQNSTRMAANPLLSTQLSAPSNFNGGRPPFMATQRQRSLNSPSGARPSPFPSDGFPGPPSPSQGQFQNAMMGGANNPNAQLRLQRQQSAPPGHQLQGSPRPYGGGNGVDNSASASVNNPYGLQMYAANMPPQHSSVVPTSGQNDFFGRTQTGEPNNNITPDFVRQGLRAVVTGRNQSGIRTPQSPLAGGMGGNSPASASQINSAAGQSPSQQPQMQPNTPLLNNTNDMDSMRFNFDIPQTGGGSTIIETKLSTPVQWTSASNNGSTASDVGINISSPGQRTTLEEVRIGDPKRSLLHTLLSENN